VSVMAKMCNALQIRANQGNLAPKRVGVDLILVMWIVTCFPGRRKG
jgi:hypothetical protein